MMKRALDAEADLGSHPSPSTQQLCNPSQAAAYLLSPGFSISKLGMMMSLLGSGKEYTGHLVGLQ